ncbi:hypothetical protein ABW19_dt0205576 [Dactylella cylindrospora]|nr:hypothetical protein ABW19_dt0205576 [Dactylella cylindrospora]
MSLQCPRCPPIASLRPCRASRRLPLLPRQHSLYPTNIPQHSHASYRAISTTLSLQRSTAEKKKWEAHKARRRAEEEETIGLISDKLKSGHGVTGEDFRVYKEHLRHLKFYVGEDIEDKWKLLMQNKPGSPPSEQKISGNLAKETKRVIEEAKGPSLGTVPAKMKRYGEITYKNQVSQGVRKRLEAQWRQREEDHKASYVKGTNLETVMEKLVENVEWRTSTTEEIAAAQLQAFDADPGEGYEIDPENFATRASVLTPGSLLEIRYTDESIPFLAVHVKNKTGNYSRESFVVTLQGSLQLAKADMSRFTIPDFVPRETIDRLLEKIQELGRLDPTIMQEITGEIRRFRSTSQELFPKFTNLINQVHADLADPHKPKSVTTLEVAKILTGKEGPDSRELYASHLAMLTKKDLFGVEESFDVTRWEIKSTSQVKRAARVEAILRESIDNRKSAGGKIVQEFVEKARRVIDFGREARESGKSIEEMGQPLDVRWNETELEILKALEEALEYRRSQVVMLKPLYPHILNLVDRYDKCRLLNEQRLFEFLGEIGACSPWEDSVLRESHLGLPGHHTNPEAEADGQKYEELDRPGALDKLGLVDKLANIRHNWGDLPVYCVDDSSTKDIDDGISIEQIDGSSEVWLRVHVANPTAFIPMDHWIAQIARKKVSTFYSPQRNYPMLPSCLSIDKLSLAPDRPAMTFSMRVDRNTGEMKEYDIRASTVNNVHRLTYDELDIMFMKGKVPRPLVLTNGPVETKTGSNLKKSNISKEDVENLAILYDLSWRLRGERISNGGFETSREDRTKLVIDDEHGNQIHPGIREQPVLDVHKPTIRRSILERIKTKDTFSWMDTIREPMALAGYAAAKWSTERGLPQLYRSHDFVWNSEEEKDNWFSLLERATDKDGYTPEEFWKLFFPIGQAEMKPRMTKHTAMGLEGYIKVTSPLRRFSDFVSHHIIQRVLLAEAEGTADKLTPMLSEQELGELGNEIWQKERQYKSAEKAIDRLWAIRLLKELWEKGDPQLSEIQDVTIISASQYPTPMSGEITSLGLTGVRVYFPSNIHKNVKYGDVVRASLSQWHWSTDSNNTQMLAMEFVDYKETMEDRKAKFWEEIGEGVRWTKRSHWKK